MQEAAVGGHRRPLVLGELGAGQVLVQGGPPVAPQLEGLHPDPQLAHIVDVGDALGLGVGELDRLYPDVLLDDVEEGLAPVAGVHQEPLQDVEAPLVEARVLVVGGEDDLVVLAPVAVEVVEERAPGVGDLVVLLEAGGHQEHRVVPEGGPNLHRRPPLGPKGEVKGVEGHVPLPGELLQGQAHQIDDVGLARGGGPHQHQAAVGARLLAHRVDHVDQLLDAELLAEHRVGAPGEGVPKDRVAQSGLAAAHGDLEAEVPDGLGDQRRARAQTLGGALLEDGEKLREPQAVAAVVPQELPIVEVGHGGVPPRAGSPRARRSATCSKRTGGASCCRYSPAAHPWSSPRV